MVNVNFLNINNATLIGRLLPFWARGRKTSLLLQALLSPIISAHNNLKAWALERFIECHITAQRSSIEWYLKYKLKKYFLFEDDKFHIADGIDRTVCCFSNDYWINELSWDNQMHWHWNEGLPWVNELGDYEKSEENYLQLINGIIVHAPAIVSTINYSIEDYERDIRFIMSKYMVCFKKVNIIITNTH